MPLLKVQRGHFLFTAEIELRNCVEMLTAFLVVTFVFAVAFLYQHGWYDASYGGRYPWAVFFTGLGAAAVPAFIAAIISFLLRIFSRTADFSATWVKVFGVVSLIFLWLLVGL
ncbi:hypothetical protein [Roseovarius aquimarinus]|uniref:Uncharacterized protein n=1 Tax=Roseovarius aquimarinus TaxID=1229156 RepID=A0ABW7I6E9_9RHOB